MTYPKQRNTPKFQCLREFLLDIHHILIEVAVNGIVTQPCFDGDLEHKLAALGR